MKVYVVTSGQYSDYGIDAIFSTLDKANEYVAFCRKVGQDTNDVDEREVDEPHDRMHHQYWIATVHLPSSDIWDGKVSLGRKRRVKGQNVGPFFRAGTPERSEHEYDLPNQQNRKWFEDRMEVQSFVSQEHARKLAAEARQLFLRLRDQGVIALGCKDGDWWTWKEDDAVTTV